MEKYVWKNALISGTHLGFEDHGILTFSLSLDFGGTGQGFGGLGLSHEDKNGNTVIETKVGEIIFAILKTVGAETWEQLKFKYVRAGIDRESGLIRAIMHITDDDRVFDTMSFSWI